MTLGSFIGTETFNLTNPTSFIITVFRFCCFCFLIACLIVVLKQGFQAQQPETSSLAKDDPELLFLPPSSKRELLTCTHTLVLWVFS